MSVMKERFPNYSSYAKADMSQLFPAAVIKDAYQASANYLQHAWIENKGNLNFEIHSLPAEAQLAPVYGIVATDMNGDGWIDLALTGNEFAMAPFLGKHDALNGLVLMNNGKKGFNSLSIAKSGFYTPANGRSLVNLLVNDKMAIAAGQNRDLLKLFRAENFTGSYIKLAGNETYAIVHLRDGQKRKEEYTYGQGFLSQSARFLSINNTITSVDIYSGNKISRTIKP